MSSKLEGAGTGQGLAAVARQQPVLPGRVELADHRRQQRVQPEAVVVVEVLVAQRQAKHPLAHQFPDAVLNGIGLAVVDELLGQSRQDAGLGLDFGQPGADRRRPN